MPFQYDLVTLLFLTIVVAAFAGWYGVLLRRSEASTSQISRLQERYESLDIREYGRGITSLDFSKCKKVLNDDDLLEAATFPRLTLLFLPDSSITDAGLAHLEGLTELEYLSISGKNITDAGLFHLYGLKKLKSIHLFNTRATPEGVKKLQKELPNANISL